VTRLYPAHPLVGVGAVILVTGGDCGVPELRVEEGVTGVVLVRRRSEPLAREWSLPGGALEVGETLAAGLQREVREETGLVVDVGDVLEVFDRITRDPDRRVRYHFVLIDYLCRPVGGRLRAGSDAGAVVVTDAAALEPYGLSPDVRRVVHRGLRTLRRGPGGVRR